MNDSMKYDCTNDVMTHMNKVRYWMNGIIYMLQARVENHDKSKLEQPEKDIFDQYTLRLKTTEFGSDEYKAQLTGMGEGLKHHYKVNRHHPEYYKAGINGMTLIDIVEMLCDWMAVAEAQNKAIDLNYLSSRFGIDGQLLRIIDNTLREQDFWNEVDGVPVIYFSKNGPHEVEAMP